MPDHEREMMGPVDGDERSAAPAAKRTAAPSKAAAKRTAAPSKAAAKRTAAATLTAPAVRARATVGLPADLAKVETVEEVEELREENPAEENLAGADEPAGAAMGSAAASSAEDEAPPRRHIRWPVRRRSWRYRAIRNAVVAVVLAAALVYTGLRVHHDDQLAAARSSALRSARTYATELATYDYRHLSTDFGLVERHSTAAFRQSFAQSSQALITVLTQYHATATATVKAAGITSASTSRAVAVVFVDQKVANSRQKGTTTDASRVQITLVRHGGGWLIDHVNLL